MTLDGETWTHDLFTARALDFIDLQSDDPFFLYLPYTVPHAAMEIPEYGPYENLDLPDAAKAYAAMISKMDSDIGLIIGALEDRGLAEETLILVSSGNGERPSICILGPDGHPRRYLSDRCAGQ